MWKGIFKIFFSIIDNEQSSYLATEYLIKYGCKSIAIVLGDENDLGIGSLREEGFLKALKDNNIEFNKDLRLLGRFDYRGAYNEIKRILDKKIDIDGIFAISDIMAVGCAKAIKDSNLEVGKDISIVGFDGMDISEFYSPTITTVKQPKLEMAELSVELLLDLVAGKTENKHMILETELIRRESTNLKK